MAVRRASENWIWAAQMRERVAALESGSEAGALPVERGQASQGKERLFFPGAGYFHRVAGGAKTNSTSALISSMPMIFTFGIAKKYQFFAENEYFFDRGRLLAVHLSQSALLDLNRATLKI